MRIYGPRWVSTLALGKSLSLLLLGPNFRSEKCWSLDNLRRPSRRFCASTSLDPPSPRFPAFLTLTYIFFVQKKSGSVDRRDFLGSGNGS